MQYKWEGAGAQLLLPHKLCTQAVPRPGHACTSCVMKLLLCRPLLRILPEVEGVPLDLSSTCRPAALPVVQQDYSMAQLGAHGFAEPAGVHSVMVCSLLARCRTIDEGVELWGATA